MITFIPDYLKTKKTCKYGAKKLPFEIRYVPVNIKLKECVIKML